MIKLERRGKRGESLFNLINPRLSAIPKFFCLALLYAYQNILASHFMPGCRFYPSCSNYMREAIQEKGVWRGLWLGGRRLLSCHPWGGYGMDPVNDDPPGAKKRKPA